MGEQNAPECERAQAEFIAQHDHPGAPRRAAAVQAPHLRGHHQDVLFGLLFRDDGGSGSRLDHLAQKLAQPFLLLLSGVPSDIQWNDRCRCRHARRSPLKKICEVYRLD